MLSKQKGVTLIELVLAIVVGAAVIAMLIPVLKFMFSVP
ncbi:prepilin-type N-terminal cleavage/methylation domain-containing protein, partial [Oleiphilus sp. HI0125]